MRAGAILMRPLTLGEAVATALTIAAFSTYLAGAVM